MKYFRTLNSKSLPTPLGWIFAATSLFLFACTGIGIQLFVEGLTQLLHYKDFEQRVYLEGSSPSILDQDLDTIINQELSPVAEFVTAQIMSEYDEAHFDRVHVVRIMREILKDISGHDYSRGLVLYRAVLDDDRTLILSNLGGDKESLTVLEQAEEEMLMGRTIIEKLEVKRRDKAEIEREMRSILPRYKVIAAEFSDAFSLNAVQPKSAREPLPLYQYGVLQGMPKIEKLRDNLPDLVTLKSEVELLHGEVKFRGESAYADFMVFKEKVKGGCDSVLAEQQGLSDSLAAIQGEISSLSDELDATRSRAGKRILQIILAHARPDLGTVSGDLYRLARAFTTKFEYLPDLPSI